MTFVVAGIATLPLPAHADESSTPVEPIEIAYSGIETCPSEDDFLGGVRRYTTKWTRATHPGRVRSFRIRLAARGDEVAGALVVTLPDGQTTTREVVGAECETVARVMAIAVAIAIDPQAKLSEARPAVPAESPAEAPRAPGESSSEVPRSSPPATAPSSELATNPAPPARSASARWSFVTEARVEMTSAVVAGALPVVGAAFETRLRLGDGAPSWLWPSFALGIRQSFLTVVDAPVGSSAFLWTAATLRLCPARLVSGPFDVTVCAEADVGVLQAGARGAPNARASITPWFDRGASVRAAYQLGKGWGLGADTLITAPSSRKRFTQSTGELISQAPPLGITAGLFVELRL